MKNRRTFIKKSAGLVAGLGLAMNACNNTPSTNSTNAATVPNTNNTDNGQTPDNPLVIFDNFHTGNRRSYSYKAKFAAAQSAGFDGFEFAGADPSKDSWKKAMDLVPTTNFKLWGFHWTTQAVIDEHADKIEAEIEKIIENVELLTKSEINPYFTLSLSGRGELSGPTIQERGSAKAEDRHWERAYKIIAAFDKVCADNNAKGSLYPHIDWLCDTPQSQVKILEGAKANTLGPAFCSHHWYANLASAELDEVLTFPIMKKLNYVVLTNVVLKPSFWAASGMQAVRFDEGEIDMAWVLAKLMQFGYQGPISSQGWMIGGDPYISCKRFVDTVNLLKKRFREQPELNPLV